MQGAIAHAGGIISNLEYVTISYDTRTIHKHDHQKILNICNRQVVLPKGQFIGAKKWLKNLTEQDSSAFVHATKMV